MFKPMVFESITPFHTACQCLTIIANSWKSLQQKEAYAHDYYFVSQLYEEDWKPRFSSIR
jgi:hypothetical protein